MTKDSVMTEITQKLKNLESIQSNRFAGELLEKVE